MLITFLFLLGFIVLVWKVTAAPKASMAPAVLQGLRFGLSLGAVAVAFLLAFINPTDRAFVAVTVVFMMAWLGYWGYYRRTFLLMFDSELAEPETDDIELVR